jgi:hypothetical protein
MTRPEPDETLLLNKQRVTVIRVDDMGIDAFNVLALTADGAYVPMEVTAEQVAALRRPGTYDLLLASGSPPKAVSSPPASFPHAARPRPTVTVTAPRRRSARTTQDLPGAK